MKEVYILAYPENFKTGPSDRNKDKTIYDPDPRFLWANGLFF